MFHLLTNIFWACSHIADLSQKCNLNNCIIFCSGYCPIVFLDVSAQFSRSVVSDSLWPRELQHSRLPCPSAIPGAHSNSCPLVSDPIQPSHPVLFFSSCLQSFPASGSFQMSQFFTSGGQSIGVSASASVLPVNIQDYK